MTQSERLARNLRAIRAKRHLTQMDVAYQADVSLSTYGKIETMEQTCRIDTLEKIAHMLGMESGELLDGTFFDESEDFDPKKK